MWSRPSKPSLLILVVTWFLINEGTIVLAKTRCPGTVNGKKTEVGAGIFAAYLAVVFSTWTLQLQA